MKKAVIFLILVNIPLWFYSQEDKIIQELQPFTAVKGFDGLSIELIAANQNKAEITGANTAKVTIVNNKGVLKIRMNIDKIFSGYRTFVKLYYAQNLKVIDVNEDALLYSDEVITQDILDVRAQEGGELKLSCNTEQLLVKAITGGDIVLEGKTKVQDVVINTGGSYKGKKLTSSFTTISVNAGGSAEVFATDYVKADVKAGGVVKVYGDPEKMDEKTVFGGKIERVE